jgi:Rieske Fe-S protein
MVESQVPARRSALRYVGGALLAVIGTALVAPALAFLSDPLRRRRRGGPPDSPIAIAELDEVPNLDSGAAPLRAAVVATGLKDAWNRFDSSKLGSVFVGRRQGALTCLSGSCPHAGCGIDFDENARQFVCPCHNSTFNLDGSRRAGPSPRDMDQLQVEVQGSTVYCQFQRFRLAVSKKEPV